MIFLVRLEQAKLVSTMDDLAPLATGIEDGEAPRLGQELLHNVGLIVGLAETDIQASCTSTCLRPSAVAARFVCAELETTIFHLINFSRRGGGGWACWPSWRSPKKNKSFAGIS